MIRILFLCTGNSCRSQMAEGWARHLHGGWLEACSAGLAPQGLNPLAVQSMREAGADNSAQKSKHLDELRPFDFDYVVTVCGDAGELCPRFPDKSKVIHRGFDDPPRLAANETGETAKLAHYHRVRDEIRDFVAALSPERLADLAGE